MRRNATERVPELRASYDGIRLKCLHPKHWNLVVPSPLQTCLGTSFNLIDQPRDGVEGLTKKARLAIQSSVNPSG